ncbi:TlpA disulfide reductase family protein [Actinomadura barringtoniae]|uniref:TlpA disulfide reductase family protein n=1 Tax=Actinomadura barringtoniae TaxID=1427535 RepID=UPI001FB6598A|nr:TlpA disulfide reductase family protein [Actinomadura barringtoniae]
MPYLTAAVVLIGLLSVLNLALTVALAKRLAARPAAPAPDHGPPTVLQAGMRPAAATAVTTKDEPVSTAELTGLVGFFSADCDPCHRILPEFAERARELGRDNVLAVIGTAGPGYTDQVLLDALLPVARVVVEDFEGALSEAFKNDHTPALYVLNGDHMITATGARPEMLPREAFA